jgi:nucleoside-diphosphate-sugar epimerase
MRALVTGGTGFVGSHVLEALARHGHAVRALARSPAKAAALGLRDVEWLAGDLDDEAALRRACDRVQLIVHVAGAIAARSELEYLAVNRDGTDRLVRAAGDTGARFVLVSSLAAAGPSAPGRPHRGDEPPAPVTAYGRSKLAAEEIVRRGPLPWTVVRPPTVYGPRDRELLRIFRAARIGIAPVFGTGSQELSLVFAADLAEALVLAGTTAAAEGGVYYAAHPEAVTAADLVRRLARVMNRRVRLLPIPPGLVRAALQLTGAAARLADRATILNPEKANEFLQPAWTCDPERLQRDTGWRPAFDLEAGLHATVEWYRSRRWL